MKSPELRVVFKQREEIPMTNRMKRRSLLAAAAGIGFTLSLGSHGFAADRVTLTFLIDNGDQNIKNSQALADAFTAANPNIKIEIETRPGGGEGDNIIKTRLATGEMTDIFNYNAGSLFQAINPPQNLLDITNEAFQANVLDSFKSVVTTSGKVYGVPYGTAMGGGILYNKKVYQSLGLSVPKTWADFEKNNEAIKAKGGIAPVIQTFKDTWTSQLFILGDYYNVQAAEPDFAANYTANKAKYATSAAARKGFERQEEVFKKGYLNEDFGSATLNDGIRMVATGKGAHYPMLTFAFSNIAQDFKDNANDVGVFGIPGDNADKNGLTVWMPAGLYINAKTEHPEEAKKFLAFVASVQGCDIQTKASGASGPYLIKGAKLPDDVMAGVKEMLPYFEKDGSTAPALEFLSPIKGPSLENITVEIGSGIRSAADGAALYDEDVRKQALQLGIAGWQ